MVMESYIQLSFVSAIFLLLCSALPLTHQQSPLSNSCSSDRGNFTANSSFSSNLDRLSSALASAAPSPGGFYNFSIGESPDQVNSIALCRGDVSSAACLSCITNATAELRSRCPNQKEAIIFYDSCMFRYSNRSILGSPETGQILYMWNPNNASNVENFNRVLSGLLDGLTTRAAGGGSVRKFATGSASAGTFQTIYALVQCTPDLSQLQCSSCLSGNIRQIPTCCDGKIGGRVIVPSCNLRYEVGPFYDPSADAPSSSSSPQPPPSTVDAAPSPSNETRSARGGNSNSTRTVIIIVAVSAVAVILILGGGTFIFCRVRKPRQRVETAEDVADGIGASDALQYDFETIRAATNDFAPANKLGQGGFGPVYKGLLGGGQEIAVKRLSRGSGQGDLEFKNEVMLVAKLQHRNLVRLFGFSLQGNEKLLVYEFVPNASLDHFLFDPFKRRELDWERRSKIIGGIARGLLYLHEDSRLRIIHRDLKASNILLDAEMNPKISDFGMAKLFALDQSQYATSRIVGTYGYMAPEYAMHGQFSVKSDVFSFGVLILEILSGQRNNCFRNGENVEDLLSCAWRNWRQGTALDFVDQILRDSSRTELLRCIHIGLLCVQENAVDRPNMASVALMLTSYSVTLPMPSEPAFLLQSSTQSEVSTSGGHHSGSDKSLRDQIAPMVADVGDLSSELDPR